jgi:adenosylcobinamide-phosphate synthase
MIVGRDTANMDEAQIIRATVETVAESTMDGIVAPLFYAFLGGPVLAWFYKSVNTMDSMVGHRNERYAEFGWAAARLDGLFNLVPSKITALAISASAFLCGKDWAVLSGGRQGMFSRVLFKQRYDGGSMSGGLRIRLGGRNFYGGLAVDKPLLGDGPQPLQLKHIGQSVRVCYLSSLLMMIAAEAFYIKIFS